MVIAIFYEKGGILEGGGSIGVPKWWRVLMEWECGNIFVEDGKFSRDLSLSGQVMVRILGFGTIIGVGISP
jgi:hypothetical protein